MPSAVVPKLFQPAQVGACSLDHRVVLAPLSRMRASATHVHGDLAVEHYRQRSSCPGTLLISEATFIAAKAGGFPHVPGIWSEEQIAAWKRVTDAVHENGSSIFCQLWALGRAAYLPVLQAEDPSFEIVSASDFPLLSRGGADAPRALTIPEISEYVELYRVAAENAMAAGFDGVEVHAANGYLVDQFIQDASNLRADHYGGSIENRCRFALDIIDSISDSIGASRTAIRFSPWGEYQDMGMTDPKPTFSFLVSEIARRHPDLAYVHVVEPRVHADGISRKSASSESNDFLRRIWAPRPFISAGGYTRGSALEAADERGDLIAFGRAFLANPDLPLRLREDLPLNEAHRESFYLFGDPKGYNDYPFVEAY